MFEGKLRRICFQYSREVQPELAERAGFREDPWGLVLSTRSGRGHASQGIRGPGRDVLLPHGKWGEPVGFSVMGPDGRLESDVTRLEGQVRHWGFTLRHWPL